MRQEVLIGVERRRRWSIEQKLEIVSEVGVGGATVSDVARRHDITRQHIYQWRSDLRQRQRNADEAPHFLPVEVEGSEAKGSDRPCPLENGRLEIGLCNGRTVRVAGDICDALLARVIRIAEGA